MTDFHKKIEPTLSHHQVWFPIKYGNNSRYVHVGDFSDGCTAVLSLDKLAEIQETIISQRYPGGSFGIMVVKGEPERKIQ
jgi:hypothetical protein